MTKKKKLIFLGIAAAVLILAGGGFFYWKSLDHAPDKEEIKFRRTLGLRVNALSIDERPYATMPCTPDRQTPEPSTFFHTNDGHSIDIICSESYMGGISISYLQKQKMPKSLTLAMKEDNSGVYWDTRSWIRYNKDADELSIQIVTLTSTPGKEEGPECSESQAIYVWSKKNQEFEKITPPEAPAIPEYAPPIAVAPECLNGHGRWAGDNTNAQ